MKDDRFPFRALPPAPPVSLRYRQRPKLSADDIRSIDWTPARQTPYDVPTANRALAIGVAGLLVTLIGALFAAAF